MRLAKICSTARPEDEPQAGGNSARPAAGSGRELFADRDPFMAATTALFDDGLHIDDLRA